MSISTIADLGEDSGANFPVIVTIGGLITTLTPKQHNARPENTLERQRKRS